MLHGISVRTICLGIVVGMIVLVGRDGICSDDKGMYMSMGLGHSSCGTFIQIRQEVKQNVRRLEIDPSIDWVGGYLTAVNRRTPNTMSILGNTDMLGAMLWLENYCNKNPLVLFPMQLNLLSTSFIQTDSLNDQQIL